MLKVEPILPRFGAECSGLDLTRPLSADDESVSPSTPRFRGTSSRNAH